MVDLVLCLVSRYDYDLNEKQKKAIDLLSKIIYQHFSRIKRQSYEEKIIDLKNALKEKEEEYQINIASKEAIIEAQSKKIKSLSKDIDFKNKSLTIPQQNLFY